MLKVFAITAVVAGGVMAQEYVIFSEDFEGTNSFNIVNSAYYSFESGRGCLGNLGCASINRYSYDYNGWYVRVGTAYAGTKAATVGGQNGIYHCNDRWQILSSSAVGDTNFSYYSSVAHMYRDVTFPDSPDPYTLSFYWTGIGEANYDYLSVHLVEISVTPTAGTVVSSGTLLGTYQGADDWREATISIPASNSETTKRLIFTWRNNGSGGSDIPVSVDDIVLTVPSYTVIQSGATFTVTSGGIIPDIKAAIDTIKTKARGEDCSIIFGDGGNFLNIRKGITFDGGTAGTDWGNITLSGKVTSSFSSQDSSDNYGTINLKNGISVESSADIQNTGANGIAIRNNTVKPLFISGGTVSSATGTAIYAENAASAVRITGGTVSTETGTAINALGASSTVTISDGAVSATTGTAISATGAASVVTITGGTVSATGTGATINATGANSRVVISGGEVTAATGNVINTKATGAAVTISGGTVSTTTSSAIYADNAGAAVAVSGGAVISSSTTDAAPTIYMYHSIPTVAGPNVSISGTGSVQNIAASNGYAIRTFGSVSVAGSAQVNANGHAIALEGARVTATISGGTVSASGGASTSAVHAIGSRVTVLVEGGTVMNAGEGVAVNAGGPNGVVFVNGGEVLADGTRIGTSGSNVITIERTGSASAYAEGSSTDLTVSPAGASAMWAVVGEKYGISYERNANTGFVEVAGVTVSTPRGDVSAKITFANGSAAYNGSERTYETATNGGFTAGSNPTWTYTYAVGDSPTGNESFSAAGKPVNAGNYSVTVVYDDSNNDGTKTVTFTVTKINPTVIWPTGLLAEAGQTLSEVSLASYTNPSGTAGAFSWTNPSTQVGAAGSRSHSVTFTPTNANYNTLTQNVTVMVSVSTAVLSPACVVPQTKPNEEVTVVAPAVVLSGEFTAGPNPVAKQSGIVNFYRQGKRVSNSELRIYDATGNIINKVRISDKAIGSQAKRQVGEWDLTDKKGRPVSEGTYLVKGMVKTSDGKSEKVSVILGVR
jgi:hypothetical protein